jgi:NAD(P)-dependent dehydrogenase (short-subunit alcohol dehydrogenase family)
MTATSPNNSPSNAKVIVITGATSGIGQVAAENLASLGARIVQIARDRTRGEAALNRLRQLATVSGQYFHNSRPVTPSPPAQDDSARLARLENESTAYPSIA